MIMRAGLAAAAPALLVACSSVWGFDDLAVGDAGSAGDASGGDATVDASQDGTSPDGPGVQDSPTTDGNGGHDGSPVDAAAHDAPGDGPAQHDAPTDTGGPSDAAPDAPQDAAPEAGDAGCSVSCVNVPSGWTLVEASFSSGTPATCGTAWAGTSALEFDTVNAPNASCACSCDAPTGASCAVNYSPTCYVYNPPSSYCADACSASFQIANGQCATSPGSYGGRVLSFTLTSAGACTPQPTTTVAPATWGGQVRTCAPTSAASCAGGTCAPALDSTFALCVEQTGDVACPSAFSIKRVEYGGESDTRGCSACTCGTPSASCAGTLTCYKDSACTTGQSTFADCDDLCWDVLYSEQVSGGSCAPSSVSPMGTATPTGAVTICCQ